MERQKRRGLRSPGRGAHATLVGGRPARSVAVLGRVGAGSGHHGPARVAAGRRRDTAERLSDGPLSLNAIAKGEIVERACAAALVPGRGVRGLLLNVGGDLRVCGELLRTLGIACPRADSESSEPIAVIAVQDRAVATSGSSQRGFRIHDRWYSHIFDPRTGIPADRVASATVIAPRSADADALATIVMCLRPRRACGWSRRFPTPSV